VNPKPRLRIQWIVVIGLPTPQRPLILVQILLQRSASVRRVQKTLCNNSYGTLLVVREGWTLVAAVAEFLVTYSRGAFSVRRSSLEALLYSHADFKALYSQRESDTVLQKIPEKFSRWAVVTLNHWSSLTRSIAIQHLDARRETRCWIRSELERICSVIHNTVSHIF
jgi:hypothetical protein